VSIDAIVAALVWRIGESRTIAEYLHPLFWASLAAILLLERALPARPGQGVLSRGLRVDVLYVGITHVSGLFIHVVYLGGLHALWQRSVGDVALDASALPMQARVAIGVLLSDLIGWAHHWVRHRVPLFWHFHAVHHAQRELNVFTDLRYHPLEYVVTTTLRAIPLFLLGAAFPVVVAWTVVSEWYTKLTHANVRTNLGPLRWLLVTPQSHRIHHSRDAAHRDTNYGVVFSFWDRLFGTQHPCNDAYPETGVDDPALPEEWSPGASVLAAPLRHFVYPFRALTERHKPTRAAVVVRARGRTAARVTATPRGG
jgi:sterol desaturase/sphingolipid hydroxylase (fatty acid hydroxylase superfamily)